MHLNHNVHYSGHPKVDFPYSMARYLSFKDKTLIDEIKVSIYLPKCLFNPFANGGVSDIRLSVSFSVVGDV